MTQEAFRDRGWHEPADSIFVRPEWHTYARCRGTMVNGACDWFPSEQSSEADRRRERAQAVCAMCPVAGPCREASRGESNGLWAGDPREVSLRKRAAQRQRRHRERERRAS